jgi:tRNA threonylcarbamoyladenosine biosynthesis protein TsaB
MILCIDTAVSSCAVSLSWEEKTIAKIQHNDAHKASEVLHTMIQQLLEDNQTHLGNIKAIAVNGGPGSYTGLRIGATTAKGLCYALNIPLIHIDGLMLLTEGLIKRNQQTDFDYYIPMIDARRMEVFTCVYNAKFENITPAKPVILNDAFGSDLTDGKVAVFGNGSAKAETLIRFTNFTFFNTYETNIDDFNSLCWKKYKANEFENFATYSPNYLKDFYSKN